MHATARLAISAECIWRNLPAAQRLKAIMPGGRQTSTAAVNDRTFSSFAWAVPLNARAGSIGAGGAVEPATYRFRTRAVRQLTSTRTTQARENSSDVRVGVGDDRVAERKVD